MKRGDKMGGLKKLFGGIEAPKVKEVAPTVQAVESADTSADTINSNTQKKKRAGFASTQGTVLSPVASESRQTLG